jgi:hypothetical protein
LRLAKWGSEVSLHGSNPEPLMSALGQKRTFSIVRRLSAYLQKRTLSRVSIIGMLEQVRSALVILPITTRRRQGSAISDNPEIVSLVFDRSAHVEIVACIPV